LVCDIASGPVLIELELPGAAQTLEQVLALARRHSALHELPVAWDAAPVGIWGRICPRNTLVRDGDRVEIYRRLPRDPRQARRARAAAARRASGTVK
jgi:putative ubiquitin-RnfH superfamily antitoxin RatB of RatAB toxin-antitoxin module